MAVGHYKFNKSTSHGAKLASALEKLEDGRDELLQEIATLIQMKDGGNLTSYSVDQFGFENTTTATAALAEMESMKGALDTAAAALDQGFAKLRN